MKSSNKIIACSIPTCHSSGNRAHSNAELTVSSPAVMEKQSLNAL